MSNRQQRRAADRAAKVAHQPVNDSYQNPTARLGIGTENLNSSSTYGFNPITRSRTTLDYMYRGSWIIGQAVDCVAEDMTRAGIDIKSQLAPDVVEKLTEGFRDLDIWSAFTNTLKWSRLYGGAVGILMIEGQKLDTPLRAEAVTKGQFKGIFPLDRWTVQPSFDKLVTAFGPEIGMPEFYTVTVDAPALGRQIIHHSRIIRFDGIKLPYWQAVAEQGWGMSVVERIYDRLVAFDSTTTGAAQLIHKAHLRTISVEDLRKILAAGGPAKAALTAMFDEIRKMQAAEGLTLIDAKDKFETHSYTFSGLSDVLLQFGQQLSGALQIPLVRLFGQSPAGMNATGESDLRTYYDLIKQQQEAKLRKSVGKVLDLVYRSVVGGPPPDDLTFVFNSLWQLSDVEKSSIAATVTDAVVKAFEAGLVDQPIAMKELRASSDVTGIWSNVSDEDIAEAEANPPMAEDPLGVDPLDPFAVRPNAGTAGPGEGQPVPENKESGGIVRPPPA